MSIFKAFAFCIALAIVRVDARSVSSNSPGIYGLFPDNFRWGFATGNWLEISLLSLLLEVLLLLLQPVIR